MTKFTRKYLSIRDLSAKLAGRSRSSIYRDIKSGQLPEPIKVGSRLLWLEDELDAFLVTRRIGQF